MLRLITYQVFSCLLTLRKPLKSVEWTFLNKCLELFHFGTSFVTWINVFYKNIQTCTINNGSCTNYSTIERRVPQGDPLSPYLFLNRSENFGHSLLELTKT